jgi:hypothetical protein
LPYKIGTKTFHEGDSMGKNCESQGDDKIVPMCWHAYRHCRDELFKEAGIASGSPSTSPSGFAGWLNGVGETSDGTVNATRVFMWYYNKRRGDETEEF